MNQSDELFFVENPEAQNSLRQLGSVGFDNIVLSNVWNRKEAFADPIISEFPNLIDMIHSNRIVIQGPDYIFTFENKNGRPYSRLKISSSVEGADNLQNLSINNVWFKLNRIISEINESNHLNIQYDENLIRISNCEINRTFTTNHPFHEYSRILNILTEANSDKHGRYSTREKLETLYLLDGKTKKLKIYDKSKQLEEASEKKYRFESSIMRYEFTVTEQNLSKLSGRTDHKCYLNGLTQEKLEEYFITKSKSIWRKSTDKLEKNLKCVDLESYSLLNKMFNLSLKYVLQTLPKTFCEQVLQDLLNMENQSYDTKLLDVDDLIHVIEKSSLDEHNKECLAAAFTEVKTNPSSYNSSCQEFVGQRAMFDELHTRIFDNVYDALALLRYNKSGEIYVLDWQRHELLDVTDPSKIGYWIKEKTNHQFFEEATTSSEPKNIRPSGLYRTRHQNPLYYISQNSYTNDNEYTGSHIIPIKMGDVEVASQMLEEYIRKKNEEVQGYINPIFDENESWEPSE